ncbi:MAG: carboxypeptidase-like regulatory domain-containing protein [Iphinoe sp. HA4291-MV1]|jgi:hypothetical protein|nr:carboxypeptidase-like regulatory domain-containing protein [Iphinoe sp. HA4291-MV1]
MATENSLSSVAATPKAAFEETRHRVAIAGSVTDEVTNQPIAVVVVEVVEHNLQTQTREDGFFYFIDLPAGEYTLNVSAPNLGTRYGTATVANVIVKQVEDGKPPEFDLKAKIKLSPTQLVGKVKRKDNGLAIHNALVQLRGSETQTFTDKEGNYILSGIVASQPNVQVLLNGFEISSQKVTLTAGKKTPVDDFNLVPVPLTGTVV